MKLNNMIEKKIMEKININNIQVFLYKQLLFNISKQKYIPRYIKIINKKSDLELLKEKYRIVNLNQFAKINVLDPLAQFYGLKIGELFEFKRNNHNSGIHIYYRLCIN